ncbi:MAG: hypothetical protein C4B59_00300 [Candidatus Methanogaster sp.]|uniref:Uncharacterized protein n=1 Tax=Candidatus Methanogaster sp. TaxID=3386292 RepID=A0AC61L798_9EURY|nr:MAG: hypothetical protein C4B59_00300 [ANME-2 cluster archaeon]
MNMRTIGIGIVAVALILAISMTASANPDPSGATGAVQINSVSLGSYDLDSNIYTNTAANILGEGTNMIYLHATTAITGMIEDEVLNITYIKEDGSTDYVIGPAVGTQDSGYWYAGVTVVDLVDVTAIMTESGTSNGIVEIVANVSRQALYPGVGGTDSAKGGFVTEMDLDGTSRTTRWQGYYGNVSGSIALADSQGHTMFSWAWNATEGGEVFATTNSSIPPWTGLTNNSTTQFLNEIDADWGWTNDPVDDAGATLNATTNVNIADDSYQIAATTAGALQPYDSQWQCGAVATANPNERDDFVFVGIIQDGKTSFASGSADYEMIVPTPDDGSAVTYYFYMELNGAIMD